MMTREEIDRHVAGILRLRANLKRSRSARRNYDRGFGTGADYNPLNRRAHGVNANNLHANIGAVDQVFDARRRAGWLPRSGDRD